ncbi:FUSC family protein [Nocardia farcinica]|uniref:FUSC family protein n=5 Tax=Nocardia farcinica TaxID=37329 RepID=UPI000DFA2187|nr:FUSC family protein [Nocardia farcinica]MBF6261257.1 FUSC family protein [Nocardia farcinica]MBF6279075.1 FUSC family protein [Nocardia farcinica]MBF6304267.1 FUSC family protein [Nocardia farcinica]MBF6389308.1 FUSC family protein [Nocardia farcinica]MBF6507104.1 FUSC family protein [Nocardia farcinica]
MSSDRPDPANPVRATAREVLDPAVLRQSLRVGRADAALAPAVRVGIAAAIALVGFGLAGHQELAGFAALGALTSLYGRYDTYRRRAALLATVGTLMTAAIGGFTLLAALGAPTPVGWLLMATLAGGMTAFVLLLRAGPPGATIVVFCAGAGMAGDPATGDVLPRTGAAATGALLAWVVCMAGALGYPTAPARLAVRRAADAVRRARAHRSADDLAAAQAALATARAALADDRSWRRIRPVAQLLTGELDAIERALYPDRTGPPTPLPPRRSLRGTARAESAGPGWILATARVTIAGLVACVASAVAGLGHAAWAVMGSTATLQADTPRHAVVRAVQRAAGTVVGALAIAWPLLAADLSFWQAACLVLVLQVATEIVIAVNYGLAQLLIAPMALLMTALGAPADPSALAIDRALDTALGAFVGVLAVLLVHPRPARARA